jgi:hypothetical protein
VKNMAVILRNGTPRTVTNDTVPIRSSTITISQTGLVSSITGYDGKVIKSINMGYLGDHKVTRLKVKLWQLSNVFVYNYEAAMVFYQEKYGIRNTVTMSSDGTCFYVDIPFDVTKTDGNYQLYFILRERISPATEGGGQVGPIDDPGYREVFISESFKGVVNNDSGYQFVRNFNWDTQVYDYNVSSIYSSVWTEEVTSVYKTEIYLGGLDTSKTYSFKVNDTIIGSSENEIITIDLPEGIQLTQGEGVVNPQLNHNVLVVYVDLESVNTDKLEKIKFSYPVDFGIPEVSSNIAQKLPIKVEYDQSMTTVVDNKSLGMKLDSYVTPINMLGLKNIISNNTLLPTKKYTIFEKDGVVYVCEAIGDYCWIPFGVTSRSGL